MKKTLLSVLIALSLLGLAACGSSGSTAKRSGRTPAPPHRIVSLSPTATEMLFAVGADKQVVAVDDQSNYPAGVPKTKLSAYHPNVEAIANYHPDLVVISNDTEGVKAGLGKLHIPVKVEPAATTVDDTYRQILDLGTTTGHPAQARKVNDQIKQGLAKAAARAKPRAKPLTYYYELDNTLYTVTSKTFIGSLFTMAHLRDVADAADPGGKSGGYPQLSPEYLVKANPDLVFLADTKCCQQSAQTFAARPGFAKLAAVTNHHVVPLDDDIASRWGPRIVELLDKVVTSANSVPTR